MGIRSFFSDSLFEINFISIVNIEITLVEIEGGKTFMPGFHCRLMIFHNLISAKTFSKKFLNTELYNRHQLNLGKEETF